MGHMAICISPHDLPSLEFKDYFQEFFYRSGRQTVVLCNKSLVCHGSAQELQIATNAAGVIREESCGRYDMKNVIIYMTLQSTTLVLLVP